MLINNWLFYFQHLVELYNLQRDKSARAKRLYQLNMHAQKLVCDAAGACETISKANTRCSRPRRVVDDVVVSLKCSIHGPLTYRQAMCVYRDFITGEACSKTAQHSTNHMCHAVSRNLHLSATLYANPVLRQYFASTTIRPRSL
jgi:hypothetical protein